MNCAELKIQSVEFTKENGLTLKPFATEYNDVEEKVIFKFPQIIPEGFIIVFFIKMLFRKYINIQT